ncbi:unnamed protein product [Adineta steineri]|uniref:Uncharacterized protein n=1 Tax=Adineta steineri TaxID=433720 RepID=A0A813R0J6_9BILA|nr:unnamed protein product [Adineta steineri]CAF3668641.1 unnamed protein product [Adineta steineri]
MIYLVFCLSILSLTNSVVIVNRRIVYHLNASYAQNSSSIVLINNQMPAPLIEAELNDILVIHVTNNLPENQRFVIHFHGMHVRQTPQMDGVAFVTQMPIESQQSFTYVLRAYPAGTYFYHSHAGLQSATAFGALIVHDRRQDWNTTEVSTGPLLFSDLWFSPDRITQENGLLASPFVWQGEPTYLLINGKRDFVLTVDPGKKYLLRLIGSTTLSTVVFGIDEHPMTVVEVDGTLVQPKANVQSIELSSGQRYGVIIETNSQSKGIFLMQLAIRWRTLVNGSSCTGILRYSTYTAALPTNLSSLTLPTLATNDELRLFAFNNPYQNFLSINQMPARAADREIFFYTLQAHTSDGLGMRWLINNASLDEYRLLNLTQPLIYDIYNGFESNLPSDITYTIKQNQLIDIVFQNTVATNGVCETHPFHLHGHKFWVHSRGTGMYTSSSTQTPDTDNPVLRDSLTLYASSYDNLSPNRSTNNYLQPCGWIKIRFLADNPGLWLLHCHIGSHLFMGMAVLIKEDTEHLCMNFLSQN